MKLRNLIMEDAIFMLEWMHDFSVVKDLNADFVNKDIRDCVSFIKEANSSVKDKHLAIVDENDEYMGTVSLKNITTENAEFAIVLRKKAMSKGYSQYAMNEIIHIGLKEMKLKEIYWCVSEKNIRAVKFYEKQGYARVNITKEKSYSTIIENNTYTEKQIRDYIWYLVRLNKKV